MKDVLLPNTCVQESHAQESFEYLLAKFNTKASAAKQAAAADSAREAAAAAEALETSNSSAAAAAAAASCLPLSAPMAMAMQLSAPMSMPFEAQQLSGGSGPAARGHTASEQMQMPYMQSQYMLYPPGGYPGMQHMALHALGGLPALHALGGLPALQAAGSPAAQLMAADMQAAALMSCGYPAALLPHPALLQVAGTPTGDCLSLMQPSLMYGSPVSGRHMAAAAGSASTKTTNSKQDKTPSKHKGSTGAASAAPGSAGPKAKAVLRAAPVCDKAVAADDQAQGAQPKAKVVLKL